MTLRRLPPARLLCSVLGGLWPLARGRICKPGAGAGDKGGLSETIFYVPQRPYVTQGSLQEQLIYPLEATPDRLIPPHQLRDLLAKVDLQHLLDRWDVQLCDGGGVCDWRSARASKPPVNAE